MDSLSDFKFKLSVSKILEWNKMVIVAHYIFGLFLGIDIHT